jgi:hypothetical protein
MFIATESQQKHGASFNQALFRSYFSTSLGILATLIERSNSSESECWILLKEERNDTKQSIFTILLVVFDHQQT